MRVAALSFSIAVVAVGYAPSLPALSWSLLPLALIPPGRFLLSRSVRPVPPALGQAALGCLLGLAWGLLCAHWALAHRLPASLAGEDFLVRGQVIGLPQYDSRRQRFLLEVTDWRPLSTGAPVEPRLITPLRRLQVSWYGGPELNSGEHWQFRLRLKPPRGFVNPSAFDYQLWLMRRGVDAVGYVRTGDDHDNRRLASSSMTSLGYWRQRARRWLQESPDLEHRGLLQALLIGDRSGLGQARWQRLQRTGTNHLLAISGLHIGFVALLGFTLGSILGRPVNLLCHRLPAHWTGHLLALGLALGYSALAGFSLPTQRALVMVVAVQLALLGRRLVRPADALILALVAVLALDPLAAFDPGFWLSFSAVGVLLLAFVGRYSSGRPPPGTALLRSQWVVFLGLLIPLALLTQGATLLAPLANLAAIPLVTFAVVPWLLIAAALAGLWPGLSNLLLRLADLGLTLLEGWLTHLDRLAGDVLQLQPAFGWAGLLLALLAVLLLLLPAGLPGRRLGYPALILALCLPGKRPPPLSLTFMDVGHGLAAVVQTPHHSLVYDTGPMYSDRMEAGGAIVAPYLRRRGISALDAVVVSHRHQDHAGGLNSLLAAVPTGQLWLGEPSGLAAEQRRSADAGEPLPARHDCKQNLGWEWDGVRFEFLFAGLPADADSNNRSCVLLIEYAGQQLLLTGDIEREVEWRLLGRDRVPEALTLLQVPHHGSASSSTPVWVEHLRPELAVISAGYQNHFNHPHENVVERYRAQGGELLHTGERGALEFEWDESGAMTRRYYRQYQKRYWYQ